MYEDDRKPREEQNSVTDSAAGAGVEEEGHLI
jgi:hypothetical protein